VMKRPPSSNQRYRAVVRERNEMPVDTGRCPRAAAYNRPVPTSNNQPTKQGAVTHARYFGIRKCGTAARPGFRDSKASSPPQQPCGSAATRVLTRGPCRGLARDQGHGLGVCWLVVLAAVGGLLSQHPPPGPPAGLTDAIGTPFCRFNSRGRGRTTAATAGEPRKNNS
jgi:hypothetical protein